MALSLTCIQLPLIGWLHVILGFHCQSIGWLHVILVVQWSLNREALHRLWHPTAAHWSVYMMPLVSNIFYQGWLWVLSCTPLRSLEWLHVIPGVLLLLTGVALCHHRCPSDTHGCSALLQVSHCSLLVWLLIIHGVSLLLTMIHWCPRCLTATHWNALASCQVSYCCSLLRFSNIRSVPLSLIGVTICHFMYTTATQCSGCLLSQVSHYCFLWWICIVPSVLLLLTRLGIYHPRCLISAH